MTVITDEGYDTITARPTKAKGTLTGDVLYRVKLASGSTVILYEEEVINTVEVADEESMDTFSRPMLVLSHKHHDEDTMAGLLALRASL